MYVVLTVVSASCCCFTRHGPTAEKGRQYLWMLL